MIVTPPILLRLVLIVFVAVLLQLGFFSQVPLLGSVANLLPVVVVALGLLGGAVTGAVTGFATGLLIDVMIGGTLGVASLSLMAAGYLAGRWREGYDIVSSLVPPLLDRSADRIDGADLRSADLDARRRRPGQRPGAARGGRPGPARHPAGDPGLPADPQDRPPGARRRRRRRPIAFAAWTAVESPRPVRDDERAREPLMFRNDENAAPTHAQFAMRVAILGGIALVAFAAIFFRLWFLEVLSGEAYLKEANANRVREIKIQAPRGEILDRTGRVLVDNKTVLSLQVQPSELPARTEPRNRELRKVADGGGDELREGQARDGQPDGHGCGPEAVRLQASDPSGDDRAPGCPGDAEAGRRQGPRLLPARAPGRVPGRHRLPGLRPRLPERHPRRPPVRLRQRDRARPARRAGLRRPRAGRPDRRDRPRVAVRPDPPRPQRRDPRPGRRLRRAPRPRALADRARARRQPEADPRQEGPGRRRGGARRHRPARRVRGDGRRRRLDPRHGLRPDLRPERVHAAGLDEHGQGAEQRRDRPAARPRDPVRLPDRLDVQGDHADRRRSSPG